MNKRTVICESKRGDVICRYRPYPTNLRLPNGEDRLFLYWSDAVTAVANMSVVTPGLYLISQDGLTLDTYCVR
jgi:hypothetical protein